MPIESCETVRKHALLYPASMTSHRGSLNATSASEIRWPRAAGPPPAAAMTTYCAPSLPMYVIGVALPLAGSSVTQSSLPVFASNARNRLSTVAPMKTRPLAVAMLPPMLRMPLFSPASPSSASSSLIPSGTLQAMSPEFASTATSAPYGGAMHGTVLPLGSLYENAPVPPPAPPRPRPPPGVASRPPPPRPAADGGASSPALPNPNPRETGAPAG